MQIFLYLCMCEGEGAQSRPGAGRSQARGHRKAATEPSTNTLRDLINTFFNHLN